MDNSSLLLCIAAGFTLLVWVPAFLLSLLYFFWRDKSLN